MNDSVDLGIGAVSIPPGTHICAFLRGVPERNAIMVPLLLEGRAAIGQPRPTWEGDRLHFAANSPPDVTRRVGSRPGHSSA
jgi:hypothetical protein